MSRGRGEPGAGRSRVGPGRRRKSRGTLVLLGAFGLVALGLWLARPWSVALLWALLSGAPPRSVGRVQVSALASSASALKTHRLGRRLRLRYLNLAGTILVAALLFIAGQTAGGTIAFFTSVKNVAGNVLSTGSFDSTAPHVVPPTNPAHQSSAPLNTSIYVTFSEPMNRLDTEAAFTLEDCGTPATPFTCPVTPTGVTGGSKTWVGAVAGSENVLKFTPPPLTLNRYYRISVGSTAKDLAGNLINLTGYTPSIFQATTSDTLRPDAPTLTSPSGFEAWTTNSTFTLTGNAEANALISVYQDTGTLCTATPCTPNPSTEVTGTPLVSEQLSGGLTSFSITVSLPVTGENRFLVTATDASGNQSLQAAAAVIHRNDNDLSPGTIQLLSGNTSILVRAPFEADFDGSGTATVQWKLQSAASFASPCPGGTACPISMVRGDGEFTYTITGLNSNTNYTVQVVYSDGPPLATQTVNIQTSKGSFAGLIVGTPTVDPIPFASRSTQSTTITATTQAPPAVTNVSVFILDSGGATVRDLGCFTLTGTNTVTAAAWDGKNASNVFVADGTYTAQVRAYNSANCSSVSYEQQSVTVVVANAKSIAMQPPPASVTLNASPGSNTACITATARDTNGDLMGDGVPILFALSANPPNPAGAGAYTLSQPSTGKLGSGSGGCTVNSNGGQAAARLTVNTANPSTLTVTATILSSPNAVGSTTINDPPDPPSGLVVSPGSIVVDFQPSTSPTIAGYYVLIGTEAGKYSRQIDIGNTTHARIEDGIVPGQRYYVAVQAYNAAGVTSDLSNEGSLIAPPNAPVASIRLSAASLTSGEPLGKGAIISAKVIDEKGSAAGGARVHFSAPSGIALSLTDAIADVDGVARTQLSRTDARLSAVTVVATSGAITESIDLMLDPPTPTPTATATPTSTPTQTATPTTTTTATATATPGPTGVHGRVEDDSSAVEYSGSWTVQSGSSFSDNKQHLSAGRDSAAAVYVDGRYVVIIHSCGPNLGTLHVWIDGDAAGDVDQRSATACWQKSTSVDTGSNGVHLLQVQAAGDPVTLDALVIGDTPPTTPSTLFAPTATPTVTLTQTVLPLDTSVPTPTLDPNAATPTPVGSIDPTPTQDPSGPTATPTSEPTSTSAPTSTTAPTSTQLPAPTQTPKPTNTPRPTNTPKTR